MGKLFRCQRDAAINISNDIRRIHFQLRLPVKNLLITLFSTFLSNAYSQVIYQHDFGTTVIDAHPYNEQPSQFDLNLSNSSWSNSTAKWTSYAGSLGQAIALKNGSEDPAITLTFDVAENYQLSISQFNFWSQRSATGATNWAMTINGTKVGSGTIPTTGSDLGNTTVSNPIGGLIGTITLQIKLTGATSSVGTFRLDDFTLIGAVTPIQTSYRSRQSGNWASPSIWEYSTDNVNWNISTSSPSKDDENILIQSGHTVIVNSAVSLDQTTIAGTLKLQTGGTLNINNGNGDDILIPANGVLQITNSNDYATSVMQADGATIDISTNGKIEIGDGSSSTGNGYEGFAISESNIWNDGAVFEYNNNGIFQIAGLTYFPKATSTAIPILRITKVNGNIAGGLDKDFHLNGLFEFSTDVTFSGAGKKNFRNGIRGTATLTQLNAGKFYLDNENAILDGSSLKLILSQPIDLGSKATIPIGAFVTVSGSNMSNTAGNLTVAGTLDMTTSTISNSSGGLIIIKGTYRTAHSGGFSGSKSSIPASTGISLNPGSTIELYANSDQSLNADDFSNLILSGSGIKTPTGPFEPDGTITIKDNAVFDCSTQNIGDDRTNLTMSGNSRLILGNFGPNPKMTGEYNLSGGVIEFNGSNGTPQNIRKENYQNIEVTGTNVLMSDGNITLNEGGTFTVKDGGTFTINDNTIIGQGNGSETITVESGGNFKCGNNKGFNGSYITSAPIQSSSIHKNITKIFLEPNSTVDYSREGNQPITNADGLIYQNLIISGSGSKTAPSDNLIIQGNLSKTSTAQFIHNNGTVIFNGSSSQAYSCAAPEIIFNNLVKENQSELIINSALSVYNQLLWKDYSTISLNADITLLSGKNHTASVGQLSTLADTKYGSGRFIIERYINTNTKDGGHPKSWQFLSAPAYGETIFDTWQEKGSTTISGYGTWITDKVGPANGFDAASVAPSMKYFNPASNNWIGIPNTNASLENKNGYMIFVRGDRQSRLVNSPATPTILRTRGKIYTAQMPPPPITVLPGKFESIGNPYASVIDFSKINFSNIAASYTAWDPTLGDGQYGLGGYQTITAATNYRAVPGNTSIYNSTSDYRNIQSGQAFFVFNYTTFPGSVSFTEECKVSSGQHLVNREPDEERAILLANLMLDGVLADGNAVAFDKKFSNAIDAEDALKISNAGENFAIKCGENILAVEAHNEIKMTDTIFYHLNNLAKQNYQLAFIPLKIQAGFEAYLTDQFLKTKMPVSLIDTTFISFSVTDDKASKIPDRFYLIFRATAPVAVSFVSMNAIKKDENVRIDWKVENENDVKDYEIEFSTDGIHFSKIGVVPRGNFDGKYTFVHEYPDLETGFYRIKINKVDGKAEYKKVVKVIAPAMKADIQIFPNPIQQKIVRLGFVKQPLGKYQFNLYNAVGQKMASEKLLYKGETTFSLKIIKSIDAAGIYQLEIIKPNGERKLLKIIVQ